MMDLDVEEDIDFDFFDERPRDKLENVTPQVSALKPPLHPHSGDKLENVTPQVSALKPPLHPHSAKQFPKSDNIVNDNKHSDSQRRADSSSGSGSSRDTSPEGSSRSGSEDASESSDTHRRDAVKSKNRSSRSSSASSVGSSISSNSSTDSERTDGYDSQSKSKVSDRGRGRGSQLDTSLVDEKRPTNPLAKPVKQAIFNHGKGQKNPEYSSNRHSDSGDSKLKMSATYQKDNRYSNETSENRDTKQAWDEVKRPKGKKKMSVFIQHSKPLSMDRPKTAGGRSGKHLHKNQPHQNLSDSDSNSDSDITDVSSIETPRNEIDESRYKEKTGEGTRITSAGDSQPVKLHFKPFTYDDEKDSAVNYDYDPDKITGFDLRILMKAVGELEKQDRVQKNSRRVMFDPTTLRSSEKSNYTFDKNQTRDIERENHRLLKEIIRQVSSGEQKRQLCRQPGSFRLTPSAVNRERDIQRIERENLAFLKRLQEVKPTKSIRRDHQLKSYDSTVYHGVPIAALHPKANGKRLRNHGAADSTHTLGGGRTDSARSVCSIGSSVHSMGSGRSSRPASAKSIYSVKRTDSRPAWTDRW